jgi:transcriptional regulator with XRE-family HTH domain
MRDRQGLTQADLAGASGLTAAAISQIENGEREPSFSTIVRLASALGTTPNDLMGIEDTSQIDPSLKPLYRKVKKLTKEDVNTVDAFLNFLAEKNKG